jgi:hypothetical protein
MVWLQSQGEDVLGESKLKNFFFIFFFLLVDFTINLFIIRSEHGRGGRRPGQTSESIPRASPKVPKKHS